MIIANCGISYKIYKGILLPQNWPGPFWQVNFSEDFGFYFRTVPMQMYICTMFIIKVILLA